MISLPLRYSQIILSCLVLISIIACTNSDEKWIPYLCKVTDYYDCQEGEKMIFPIETTYADKETCYSEFERIWITNRELSRRYPQTDNPDESYIFGCIQK